MNKIIISVLGQDRPGIIAAVSRILLERDCNIENVSQTILQSEFSGIFLSSAPKGMTISEVQEMLQKDLSVMHLHVFVKPLAATDALPDPGPVEPFIITTRGPDRKGLVAGITAVIAGHGVNVTNLQAVFKGGDDPNRNIMIYEVDMPASANQSALMHDLKQKADELGLMLSIQHRHIFEAINRI